MVLSLAVQLSRIRGSITHHLAPYLAKFQLFSNLWLLKSVCAQTCATDLEIWISDKKKNGNTRKAEIQSTVCLCYIECFVLLFMPVVCVGIVHTMCFLLEYTVCLCSSLDLALCCAENIVCGFLWIQCVCLCSALDLALCCAENI